jgi:hypothetical protein
MVFAPRMTNVTPNDTPHAPGRWKSFPNGLLVSKFSDVQPDLVWSPLLEACVLLTVHTDPQYISKIEPRAN